MNTIERSHRSTMTLHKRRPRAMGEVAITCPSSSVYLANEHDVLRDIKRNEFVIYENIDNTKQRADIISCPVQSQSNTEARNSSYDYVTIQHPANRSLNSDTSLELRPPRRDYLSVFRTTSNSLSVEGSPSGYPMDITTVSTYLDDLDHIYEQLSPQRHLVRNQLRRSTKTFPRPNSSLQRPESSSNGISSRVAGSNHTGEQQKDGDEEDEETESTFSVSDDTNSTFDTDIEETPVTQNGHKDNAGNMNILKSAGKGSGVDIGNMKLPDPPHNTNQMYSIVKRFKNFIVSIKHQQHQQQTQPQVQQHSNGKNRLSQHILPDQSSQFYVDVDFPSTKLENTNADNSRSQENLRSSFQSEFDIKDNSATTGSSATLNRYSLKSILQGTVPVRSSTSNSILTSTEITALPTIVTDTTTSATPKTKKRTKVTGSKSLRLRLRHSSRRDNKQRLLSANTARSTFYVVDNQTDTMDSGFSEKVTTTPNRGSFYQDTNSLDQRFAGELTTNDSNSQQQKRLNVCSTRPLEPPPPPPPTTTTNTTNTSDTTTDATISSVLRPPVSVKGTKPVATSSWYTECGVFGNINTKGGEVFVPDGNNVQGQENQAADSNGTTTTNDLPSGTATATATATETEIAQNTTDNTAVLTTKNKGISSQSSWYEEIGLYQTSGTSLASSSGSSGVSTSGEAGPSEDIEHSVFRNEPLYQIYTASKLEAISRDMGLEQEYSAGSSDSYEEVGIYRNVKNKKLNNEDHNDVSTTTEEQLTDGVNQEEKEAKKLNRPTALQLVEPRSGATRTLWCEIPEVINSGIINNLTPRERTLMEAKFEIITSEASYLKSLNLLRTHYIGNALLRDTNVISPKERKILFSRIIPVHECSEKLLSLLEACWQENMLLTGLSDQIYNAAEKYFKVYVNFCENQGHMDRTLKRLKDSKGLFSQNLEIVENNPVACGLGLHSFLMLPMQRITRLPLLIDAVFKRCNINDSEYDNWKLCLAMMNKIVAQCNEAANRTEQIYELQQISQQLEFNITNMKPLQIVPYALSSTFSVASKTTTANNFDSTPVTNEKNAKLLRFLVKRGELTQLIWRGEDLKLSFGRKIHKMPVYAFLFTDLLLLTRRKGQNNYQVFDYCLRNMLAITAGDLIQQLPSKDLLHNTASKNLIVMTLLENYEHKTIEYILSCPSVSEQERWLQAVKPPVAETPGEKLYEQWDCPQVMAKYEYKANEPDALNLEVGDVINVTRKLPDGWYYGERIRDFSVGWFPSTYTEEVNSAHVRARNLKQRHRLLTFTATYLEAQKRSK